MHQKSIIMLLYRGLVTQRDLVLTFLALVWILGGSCLTNRGCKARLLYDVTRCIMFNAHAGNALSANLLTYSCLLMDA